MSALPCPVAIRVVHAADQTYAQSPSSCVRGGAASEIANWNDSWRGMGGVAAEIGFRRIWTMRQPGKAVEPCGMRRARRSRPPPVHARSLRASSARWRWPAPAMEAAGTRQSAPAGRCAQSAAGEVLSGSAAASSDGSGQEARLTRGLKTLEYIPARTCPSVSSRNVIRAAQDFEAFDAERQAGARADSHAGSILVLTVDGKGVVMRPEESARTHATRCGGAGQDLHGTAGERSRPTCKRMAAVAAIYTVEPYVRTPEEILTILPRSGKRVRAATARTQNGSGPAWRSRRRR